MSINITRWPVVVYTNYRSGSSIFSKDLAHKHNVPLFVEPIRSDARLKNFLYQYHSGIDKFVLKIMPDQVKELKETEEILNSNCFRIKLTRRNIIDQITSYYIASITDKWGQTEETIDSYNVKIDLNVLRKVIDVIKFNNQMLDESNLNFDHVVYYEDLNFSDITNWFYKTTSPNNIDIIKKIVTRIYEQR